MAFWSKLGSGLKKAGKVALKAAPIAAAFIPGVGPLAAMGIGAAAGGASKAIEGKGLGGILGGAAMGSIPGAAKGALGGIGPSQGFMSRMFGPGSAGVKGIKSGAAGLKAAGKFLNRPRRPVYGTPGFNPNAPSPYGMMGGQQQMGPMMQNFRNRQTMMAPRANQFQNLGY